VQRSGEARSTATNEPPAARGGRGGRQESKSTRAIRPDYGGVGGDLDGVEEGGKVRKNLGSKQD